MKFNKKVVICMIMILSMLLGGCGTSLGSSVKKVKLDPDNSTKVQYGIIIMEISLKPLIS